MVILVAMVGFLIWMTLVLVKTWCYKGTIWDNMYWADRLPNQPISNWIYWWIGIILAILSTIFSVLNPSQQLQNNTINQMIQQKIWWSMMPSSNDMMNQININTTQPVNQQIDNAIQLEDKSAITNATVTN